MCFVGTAGKENNGFDPNIQLVPGGSWAGSGGGSGKPTAPPAPSAQSGAPGVRPAAAPAPGLGGHTFSGGGWGSTGSSHTPR